MAEQWEEEQHVDGIVERRRMDGSSLNSKKYKKILELVVTE